MRDRSARRLICYHRRPDDEAGRKYVAAWSVPADHSRSALMMMTTYCPDCGTAPCWKHRPQIEIISTTPGFVAPAPMGWKCPGCGRCYAPAVEQCKHCGPDALAGVTVIVSNPDATPARLG